MKTTYIRPDIGVPVDDTDLIREVDWAGTVHYLDGDGFHHREGERRPSRKIGDTPSCPTCDRADSLLVRTS